MKTRLKTICALLLVGALTSCGRPDLRASYDVIPLPQEVLLSEGNAFRLDNHVKIRYADPELKRTAEFLSEFIDEAIQLELPIEAGEDARGAILLKLGLENPNTEAYRLTVNADGVEICGATKAGVFYGVQSLRKSLPLEACHVLLPQVTINDQPRFAYRGMMLDVGRHFYEADSIKTFIDILALHNINRFHWHLTEDQGWRIEIKKYPRLTEVGSMRQQTVIGHNTGVYDGVPHGGFYTQEQIRDIVAYASERNITIIPEIDMPGHMLGAVASYPELGCTGGPYKVWEHWGVSDDVLCVGNAQTLEFAKDVLREVMELFPSKYIHVGGDECLKTRWEKCPKCQAKISELGLVSDQKHTKEERLQSYFLSEIEHFLNENGRQMIGWDEILEGGLAPNATVMAWRSVEAGKTAAQMGHHAIMTPTSHLYFDYYQGQDIDREPMAIGGYIPVELVYSFEPLSENLTKEERGYIMGTQANLWTEYIPTFDQALYMALPRMDALCEVQWTDPQKKDYASFLKRLPRMFDYYTFKGYPFGRHLINLTADFSVDKETGDLVLRFATVGTPEIRYTTDGAEPTASSQKYNSEIRINKSCTLKACAFRNTGKSQTFVEEISFNKASLKPITLLQPTHKNYTYKGAETLVNGLRGNKSYKTGHWIAFEQNDLEAVIDLGRTTPIEYCSVAACIATSDWVLDMRGLAVYGSQDGKKFKLISAEDYPAMKETDPREGIVNHELKFDSVNVRYVKVVARSEHSIPEWHGGKGDPAFLFVDEIVLK